MKCCEQLSQQSALILAFKCRIKMTFYDFFAFHYENLSGNIEDCVKYTFVVIKETESLIEMHQVHDQRESNSFTPM